MIRVECENPDERWALCFHDLYAVSNMGRVKRVQGYWRSGIYYNPCGKVLKPFKSQIHVAVSLLGGPDGRRVINVHRLVSLAFMGPCPEGMEVNHINGDGTDNRVSNLEYVTRSENMRHAYRTGLIDRKKISRPGERNANAILSLAQVRECRATRGVIPAYVLAKKLGVSRSAVQAVRDGQSWGGIS